MCTCGSPQTSGVNTMEGNQALPELCSASRPATPAECDGASPKAELENLDSSPATWFGPIPGPSALSACFLGRRVVSVRGIQGPSVKPRMGPSPRASCLAPTREAPRVQSRGAGQGAAVARVGTRVCARLGGPGSGRQWSRVRGDLPAGLPGREQISICIVGTSGCQRDPRDLPPQVTLRAGTILA